jgi:hypothetical protein
MKAFPSSRSKKARRKWSRRSRSRTSAGADRRRQPQSPREPRILRLEVVAFPSDPANDLAFSGGAQEPSAGRYTLLNVPPLDTPPRFRLRPAAHRVRREGVVHVHAGARRRGHRGPARSAVPERALVRDRRRDGGVGILEDVGVDLEAGRDRVAGIARVPTPSHRRRARLRREREQSLMASRGPRACGAGGWWIGCRRHSGGMARHHRPRSRAQCAIISW